MFLILLYFADLLQLLLGIADEADVLAAGLERADQFELVDDRGGHWVDTLDADAFGDLADRHGAADACALDHEHGTLKDLDTLLFLTLGVGFLDLLVDTDLLTRAHFSGGQDLVFRGFGHRFDVSQE